MSGDYIDFTWTTQRPAPLNNLRPSIRIEWSEEDDQAAIEGEIELTNVLMRKAQVDGDWSSLKRAAWVRWGSGAPEGWA